MNLTKLGYWGVLSLLLLISIESRDITSSLHRVLESRNPQCPDKFEYIFIFHEFPCIFIGGPV